MRSSDQKTAATIHVANSLQVAVTNLSYTTAPWRRKDGSQLKLADIVAKVENRTTEKISRSLNFIATPEIPDRFWLKRYGSLTPTQVKRISRSKNFRSSPPKKRLLNPTQSGPCSSDL
jgi:hypothetical protein